MNQHCEQETPIVGSNAIYHLTLLPLFLALLLLGGCGSLTVDKDYGPSRSMNSKGVRDIQPRDEPVSRYGNPPSYVVFGKRYHVMKDGSGFTQRGIASWYGKKFHGRLTSNRERYNMYAMSAAHKTLPLPTYLQVTNLDNGRSTIVRVNDRGPFHQGRIIDLSYAAASKLGIVEKGTGNVKIAAIGPGSSPAAGASNNRTGWGKPPKRRTGWGEPPKKRPGWGEPPKKRPGWGKPPKSANGSEKRGSAGMTKGNSLLPSVTEPKADSDPLANLIMDLRLSDMQEATSQDITGQTRPDPIAGVISGAPLADSEIDESLIEEGAKLKNYLQLGAFSTRANAKQLQKKLLGHNISKVHLYTGERGGKPLFRVRIGPIADLDEAERLADEIAGYGLGDPQLVLE